MTLTLAIPADLPALCDLYRRVSDGMEAAGLHQWHWGDYPNEDLVRQSVEAGSMYVLREGGALLAAVTIDTRTEPEHEALTWRFGGKVGTFHRLAIAPEGQGRGMGRALLAAVCDILRKQGCQSLHIDTHMDNEKALRLYERAGMRRSGTLNYPSDTRDGIDHWVALEMPLTEDCPGL